MADSLSTWLALREPADTAARSATRDMLAGLTAGILRGGDEGPLRIVDLAAGTGSNLRYLATRLPVPQEWLLVDHNPVLLAEVASRLTSWGAALGYETVTVDTRVAIRGDKW